MEFHIFRVQDQRLLLQRREINLLRSSDHMLYTHPFLWYEPKHRHHERQREHQRFSYCWCVCRSTNWIPMTRSTKPWASDWLLDNMWDFPLFHFLGKLQRIIAAAEYRNNRFGRPLECSRPTKAGWHTFTLSAKTASWCPFWGCHGHRVFWCPTVHTYIE